jgi:hypothetical protein
MMKKAKKSSDKPTKEFIEAKNKKVFMMVERTGKFLNDQHEEYPVVMETLMILIHASMALKQMEKIEHQLNGEKMVIHRVADNTVTKMFTNDKSYL